LLRGGAEVIAALAAGSALPVQGAEALNRRDEKRAAEPVPPRLQTATTHPMKYYLSLPREWTASRTWPVLVAPNAHYGDKGKNLLMFAAERDRRKANFIIIQPLVINADRVEGMMEYRGAVAGAIKAADAATDGRDEAARAKFDEEGIQAILTDVRRLYRGEEKVCITGFSSSTHVAYLFLFNHPELLKGVMINSGVYLGRGVDEAHLPLPNSAERAGIGIKYIVGENDRGYPKYLANWTETKAKLLRIGHPENKIAMEIIQQGNPGKLGSGHQWFTPRILDFCSAVESTNR
jgi:predicted esterase